MSLEQSLRSNAKTLEVQVKEASAALLQKKKELAERENDMIAFVRYLKVQKTLTDHDEYCKLRTKLLKQMKDLDEMCKDIREENDKIVHEIGRHKHVNESMLIGLRDITWRVNEHLEKKKRYDAKVAEYNEQSQEFCMTWHVETLLDSEKELELKRAADECKEEFNRLDCRYGTNTRENLQNQIDLCKKQCETKLAEFKALFQHMRQVAADAYCLHKEKSVKIEKELHDVTDAQQSELQELERLKEIVQKREEEKQLLQVKVAENKHKMDECVKLACTGTADYQQ